MDHTKEGSEQEYPRTPHGVRIDRQVELYRSEALENLKKKAGGLRGQKRRRGGDGSLFVQTDDDDQGEQATIPSTLATPAGDAPEGAKHGPSESSSSPEKKKMKRSQRPSDDMKDCTCAISSSPCPRAQRLGENDCRKFAPDVRKPAKPKKEVKFEKFVLKDPPSGRNPRTYQDLLEFMATFRKVVTAGETGAGGSTHLSNLRGRLDNLPFLNLPSTAAQSPEVARFLGPNTGIPLLFDCKILPWHIRIDARALYDRWNVGDLDHNLLRGIEFRTNSQTQKRSRALEHEYRFKRNSDFVGEGHLHNGQWFPYQICALRDGAHGELEAGISGTVGTGAVSIVMSSSGSKNTYADVDEGEEISYCGTLGKKGRPSGGTSLLIQSAKTKNPIRVLRSSRLPNTNKFRPAAGIRYDGMYEVKSYELLDEETHMHRFKLVRLDNQFPIRYTGDSKRPNSVEIKAFKDLKQLMGQNG